MQIVEKLKNYSNIEKRDVITLTKNNTASSLLHKLKETRPALPLTTNS
jgi:hypothetical protein